MFNTLKISKSKSKFVLLIIALIICALIIIPSALSKANAADTSKNEGNNTGDPTATAEVSLILDVNGRSAREVETLHDNSNTDFDKNNAQHLRVRSISRNAVFDAYKAHHSTDAAIAGETSSNYVFDVSTIRCASSEIEIATNATSGSKTAAWLYITAVKATEANMKARFSIAMIYNGENDGETHETVTVYFDVEVQDTFAITQPASAGGYDSQRLFVGAILGEGDKAKPAYSAAYTAKTIDNFSSWQFNLSDYLNDRALYYKTVNAENKEEIVPARMVANNTAAYWTINSVNCFRVTRIEVEGVTGGFDEVSINNPTAELHYSPNIDAKLSLSTKKIRTAVQAELQKDSELTEKEAIDNFWNSVHNIIIDISTVNGASKATICVPVKFSPANPQRQAINTDAFNLTIISEYVCDYNGGVDSLYYDGEGKLVDYSEVKDSGYSAIIIRPSDLVDYSYPSTYGKMTFLPENTDLGGKDEDYRLEVVEGNDLLPEAYKIIAQKNNQYSINFQIQYYLNGDTNEENVLISVNGNGDYTIKFDTLNGKKSVSYNVMTSGTFKQLRDANYILTDAESLNKDQLNVTFENNVVTLTPRLDKISGTAIGKVKLTFTNTNGQKLIIESKEFNINVEAGSFWNRFENWQAWLIIAACIIGGIAIILFIVWIFIHTISKRKQEENATTAPVSSYIVKLNSTIAATQAQQRIAATQALSQATSQMLLGAGPTGTQAPPPDTLQLASGMPSMPQATTTDSTPSAPAATSAPKETEENYDELIANYITDEELLERIFTEKYEPKGMVRRTFFKSKDLQARELEKEKKRIIERYKSPMPMDEAIMSEAELKKAESTSQPSAPKEVEEPPKETDVLGFDPDAPLYVEEVKEKDEFSEEKIDIDQSPEESRLADVQRRNEIIEKELAELKSRIDKVQAELNKNKKKEDELREKISKAEADDEKYAQDIEDLEFKLASAKAKEKDRITRDINHTETKKSRNLDHLEKLRAELDALLNGTDKLDDIMGKLSETRETKTTEQSGIVADLDKAKADYDAYQDRLAKVRARKELETKLEGLSPMLFTVNSAEYEMNAIDVSTAKLEKELESLQTDTTAAKAQILGANDFNLINELNTRIADNNARISEIKNYITKDSKRKSELNIEFTSMRRKANEYVEKNEIPLEDIISAEDQILGNIELENLRSMREKDREDAENAVAAAQAVYDDISTSSTDVTMIAMEVASGIQELETELEKTQSELNAINEQMETANDDEKLMLMVDQGDKSDKVEELKEKIKQANIDGTKRKMEAQAEYDEKLESARAKLDEATEDFKLATAKYDALADTNPLDLIMSGNGVISKDQKIIEANNLKKQLEKSKNEIEQARLAAQQAQSEAEQARLDAERASDEARAEAERMAQEAKEQAEEAERARREAEEAAEQARKEAEEAAEQARREAEEAAEQARREAEEAVERAKRDAEVIAEQARREAEEATEQARREAEEAAERARRDAEESVQSGTEEAKRKAQEEIDEVRRKAEEDAEAKRLEDENRRRENEERQKAEDERRAAIAAKVASRKEKIVVLRERMKDIKGDDDAKNLREQLYTMQLTFDEDERGSTELMDFYNKTMDDIQHSGEVATLKAENAKKPQRVIKKVTERVNRTPKKKARPAGSKPGARPRPAGSARPRPAGSARPRPGSARPRPGSGARPRPGSGRPRPPRG